MIVNETVLFPKVEYRIETQDEKTEKLINTIEQSKDQQVIMIHSLDGVSLDNVIEFPSLGVLSTLTLKLLVPNSKTRAVFLCHERVKVTNYEKENDIWYVDIEDVNVKEIPKEKNTLYIDMLLRSYEKYSNLIANTSNAMLHQLSFVDNLSDLTDSLAVLLPFSIELKKKYLYEEDPIKRAITLLEQLKEEIALAKIENEIDEKVREEVTDNQKKFYLQTKLKVIKEELGEEDYRRIKQYAEDYRDSYEVKTVNEYFGPARKAANLVKKATFNGWLLPADKKIIALSPVESPFQAFRKKKVVLFEPFSGKAVLAKKDWKQMWLACGLYRDAWRLMKKHKSAAEKYRNEIQKFTCMDAWKQYLEIEKGTKK